METLNIEEIDYINDKIVLNKKSKLIGVIAPINLESKDLEFENPFYFEFLLGVEKYLRKHSYDIIVSNILNKDEYSELIIKRDLDGLILVGKFDDVIYKEIEKLKIPLISVDHVQNIVTLSKNIVSDNYKGGYIVGEYAAKLKEEKIGVISDDISVGICKERFEGFKKALNDNGMDIKGENIAIADMNYEGGIEAADSLLEKELSFIFVTGDMMALGALKLFLKAGVEVPEELSIVGFDDIYSAKLFYPSLSTINQNIYYKGKTAGEELIKLMNEKSEREDITIDVGIVLRESSKKI